MNKVHIIGRLVAAPEGKSTPNGVTVAEMRIAVPTRADREKSYFFNVIAWRGLAELCCKYLVKGQKIAITGELQSRSYEVSDGSKRYVTEIRADEVEFLDKPRDSESPSGDPTAGFSEYTAEDGELPF